MAITLTNLLETLSTLVGHTPVRANLSAAITTTSATTFTVANSDRPINTGDTVEVDDELMTVTSVSRVSGSTDTVTVVRGVLGSTAATHSGGAAVGVNPIYPRWQRKHALNLVLMDWVTTKVPLVTLASDQTFSSTSEIVMVPAATISVLSVEYRDPASQTRFVRVPHGRPREYPTALVSTGRGVPLASYDFPAGYPAYVRYTTAWAELTSDASELPASWVFGKELLAQGAAGYLLEGKHIRRGTYDAALAQRQEQQSGADQTAKAGERAMARYEELLTQAAATWPGSKTPQYVEVQ